jgi:hypothetical protein
MKLNMLKAPEPQDAWLAKSAYQNISGCGPGCMCTWQMVPHLTLDTGSLYACIVSLLPFPPMSQYVHAGYIGRAVFMEGEGSLPINAWQVGLGLGATLLALGFVGQLAKKAVEEVDKEEQQQTMTGTGEGSSRGQGQQLNGKGSSSGVEW